MNRGAKEDRVDVALDYNPYAQIDAAAAANPFEVQTRQGDLSYQHDEISCYTLPVHKNPIDYFKFMHHDIYESEKRYYPNILMTVTSRNEVFIWQENLMVVRS